MPALRLGPIPDIVSKFDVIGTDAPTGPMGFVGHLSMSNMNYQDIMYGSVISVTHMAPPFRTLGEMRAHTMGSASLSQEEVLKIEIFLFNVAKEYKSCLQKKSATDQYIAHPHKTEVKDKIDGLLLFRRFSCAGLVVEAYRYARVDLVKTEDSDLPPVMLDTLRVVYPDIDKQDKKRMGLSDPGPWPILLPGYILHALERTREEIRAQPYAAKPGDEVFN